MLVTDQSGATKLDTNGKLFHVTDSITGSKSIPARLALENDNLNIVVAHNLGPCLTAATHVIGSFKVAVSGGTGGVPPGKWFAAGGTYLHLIHPYNSITQSENRSPNHIVHYTFRCTGGRIYMDEVCRLGNVGNASFVVHAHTITYKLKAGLFT